MNDNLAIYGILFASDYDTDNDTLKKIFKGCCILVFFIEPILLLTEKIVYIGRQETEIPLAGRYR